MFASATKKELKFGETDFIVIRKLSGYQLDICRDESQARNVGHLRRLGGELITAMNSAEMNQAAARLKEKKAEEAISPEAKAKARLAEFDRMTTLKQGIVSWSASNSVTDEGLRDLDDETSQTTFEEIIDLTLPSTAQIEATEEKGA